MKAFPMKGMLGLNGQMIDHVYETGMDLRDYFAASAPVFFDEALESLQLSTKAVLTEKYDVEVIEEIARLSYLYADAMMKARK
jgi:hypothetical protein